MTTDPSTGARSRARTSPSSTASSGDIRSSRQTTRTASAQRATSWPSIGPSSGGALDDDVAVLRVAELARTRRRGTRRRAAPPGAARCRRWAAPAARRATAARARASRARMSPAALSPGSRLERAQHLSEARRLRHAELLVDQRMAQVGRRQQGRHARWTRARGRARRATSARSASTCGLVTSTTRCDSESWSRTEAASAW